MKLHSEKREIEVSGFANTGESFGITTSPMMFKILSDKMYSDKISAVIREYCCNAYDSHITAGTHNRPFEVHLPNRFEPYFSVRDYGTGLSEREIFEVYTQYGMSTKSDSNSFIGALGLGSKSAFAYVDQYTVESYYNGEKKTYNGFLGEDGSPKMIKISEEPTDEPNGVRVHLFVEVNDFSSFAEKAKKIFFRFPVLPIITGASIELEKVNYVIEGPNYKVREASNHNSYSYYSRGDTSCYAIQGVVAYPIKVEYMSEAKLTDIQKTILNNMSVDIVFDIGELDIAPSREELSYDKRTQANIVKALDKIIAHAPSQAVKLLEEAKTEWEVRSKYYELMRSGNSISHFLRGLIKDNVKWKGKNIDQNGFKVYTYDRKKAVSSHLELFKKDFEEWDQGSLNKAIEENDITKYGTCTVFSKMFFEHPTSKRYQPFSSSELTIPARPDVRVVLIDTEKVEYRLKRFIQHNFHNENCEVYVFKVKPENHDKIIDQLGGYDSIIYTSELEEPPVASKTSTASKSEVVECYEVKGWDDYSNPPLNLERASYDATQGGIYIMMYSKQIVARDAEFDYDLLKSGGGLSSKYSNLIKEAYNLGLLKDVKVFAFNSSKGKFLKDDPNWISIYDFIKEKTNEVMDKDKELLTSVALNQSLSENSKSYTEIVEVFHILSKLEFKKSNSKMNKYLQQIGKIIRDVNAYAGRSIKDYDLTKDMKVYYKQFKPEILDFFNEAHTHLKSRKSVVDADKITKAAEKMDKSILESYPLLSFILDGKTLVGSLYGTSHAEADRNIKELEHYINLCDASPSLVKELKN